jgi:hypothetical protein
MSFTVKWGELLPHIQEIKVQISVWRPPILTEVLDGFPQSLKGIGGIVSQIKPWPRLYIFQLLITLLTKL